METTEEDGSSLFTYHESASQGVSGSHRVGRPPHPARKHFNFIADVGKCMCRHCEKLVRYRLSAMLQHLANCDEFTRLSLEDLERRGLPFIDHSKLQKKKPIQVAKFRKMFKNASPRSEDIQLLREGNDREIIEQLFPPSRERAQQFREDLVRACALKHLPFTLFEEGYIRSAIAAVNPFAVAEIPSSYMAKKILKQLVDDATAAMEDKLVVKVRRFPLMPASLTMAVDTWISTSNEAIFGVVVSCSNISIPCSTSMSFQKETGANLAIMVEDIIQQWVKRCGEERLVNNFVSDDAGACGKARRILALRYPYIVFQKCFAHQINLACRDFLQTYGHEALLTIRKLMFKVQKSKTLQNIYLQHCQKCYGKHKGFKLKQISEIRWNSAHSALSSVLRVRSALLDLAGEEPAFSAIDASLIRRCSRLEKLLRPITEISIQMQRGDQTIGFAMESLLILYRTFMQVENETRTEILQALESRWRKLEQPLFLVAYMLHNDYYLVFRTMCKVLQQKDAVKEWLFWGFVGMYVRKYIPGDVDVKAVCEETEQFLNLSGERTSLDEKLDSRAITPALFCKALAVDCPSVSQLAYFLQTATCQSATCERLFSAYKLMHTKTRNRLKHDNMRDLAVLRHHLKSQNSGGSSSTPLSPEEYSRLNSNSSEREPLTSGEEIATELLSKADSKSLVSQLSQVPYEGLNLDSLWPSFFESEEEEPETSEADNEADVTQSLKDEFKKLCSLPSIFDPNKFYGTTFRTENGPIAENSPQEALTGLRSFKIELRQLFLAWMFAKKLELSPKDRTFLETELPNATKNMKSKLKNKRKTTSRKVRKKNT